MTRLVVTLFSMMTLGATPPTPSATTPVTKTSKPDLLSPLARELLRKRMERHGDSMVRLVLAVTLLQRDQAKRFATEIANEPRMLRPLPGDEASFNSGLPERLFVLQDELRSRAQTLATLSGSGTDTAMASSLGLLMQTCVSCHSLFLSPEVTATP